MWKRGVQCSSLKANLRGSAFLTAVRLSVGNHECPSTNTSSRLCRARARADPELIPSPVITVCLYDGRRHLPREREGLAALLQLYNP
eukprot:COSAG03_NODE_269_length_9603_cov_225.864927_5_plen_87_part_00